MALNLQSILKNLQRRFISLTGKNRRKNNFYIAEEVTINGNVEKRPDIFLDINGIAVAVIELK